MHKPSMLSHAGCFYEQSDEVAKEDGGLNAAGACLPVSPINEVSLQEAFVFQGKSNEKNDKWITEDTVCEICWPESETTSPSRS